MTIYRLREILREERLRHERESNLDTLDAQQHAEVAQALRLADRIVLVAVAAEIAKSQKGARTCEED